MPALTIALGQLDVLCIDDLIQKHHPLGRAGAHAVIGEDDEIGAVELVALAKTGNETPERRIDRHERLLHLQ